MINPTEDDIGRAVIYRSRNGVTKEEGVITSFNDFVVFVRYGSDKGSKGARRTDLEWANG